MRATATALHKPDQHLFLRCLAIATPLLLTAITFSVILNNGFTNWDDNLYVTDNPLIRSISLQNICKIFSPETFVGGNYQPITILSLALNYALGKLNPVSYIATNILLHLVNVLLVYLFIRKISRNDRIASLCAILFGVHPMHVESVAWVTGRKDLLYVLFYLAALLWYLRYLDTTGKRRAVACCFVFAFLALSLLSKSAAVTLPAVLLLLDRYAGRRFSAGVILEKIPFIVPAIFLGFLAVRGQQSIGALGSGHPLTLVNRLSIGSYSCAFYMVKFFAPVKLTAFYSYPHPITGPLPLLYSASPYFCIVVAGLVYYFRRSKVAIFGFFFFLVNIIFVLHFVPVGSTVTADRFSYLSYVGLFYIIAYSVEKAIKGGFLKNIPIYVSGISIIALLCFASYRRGAVWKDSISLWTDAVSFNPSPAAYNIFGNALLESGRSDEALSQFEKAEEIDSGYADSYENQGKTFLQIGRPGEAVRCLRKALTINPGNAKTHNNLGIALFETGGTEEAIAQFREAVDLFPDFADAQCNLGNALLNTGRTGEAIVHYRKAVELAPDYAAVYKNLAVALIQSGEAGEALTVYRKAFALARSSGQEEMAKEIEQNIDEMRGMPNEANLAGRK